MRVGIIATEYHWDGIVEQMVAHAQEEARKEGAETELVKVPGCYELPLAAQRMLAHGVDGVVTLGVVMKGETQHDEVIATAVAKSLLDLSLAHKKPVVFGVQGPGVNREQAIARIPRAAEVMRACVQLIKSA